MGGTGSKAVYLAAENGDVDELQRLLALNEGTGYRKRVEAAGKHHLYTPLHIAVVTGHLECVKVLLHHRADRRAKDKRGYTPLHLSVMLSRLEIMETLLSSADTRSDETDMKVSANDPLKPLMCQMEWVAALLSGGSDINEGNDTGATPLHVAVVAGQADCLTRLVEAGANINARDRNGATPLHSAAMFGRLECVRALLKAGADKDARANKGSTPLLFVCEGPGQHPEQRLACLNALLQAGANTDHGNDHGATPLHCAAKGGHLECVTALLAAGATPDIKTKDSGTTPLQCAERAGHADCAKAIADATAARDSKAQGDGGCTTPPGACPATPEQGAGRTRDETANPVEQESQ